MSGARGTRSDSTTGGSVSEEPRSNWPLFDSGLLGPVTLIPEKEFDPGKK